AHAAKAAFSVLGIGVATIPALIHYGISYLHAKHEARALRKGWVELCLGLGVWMASWVLVCVYCFLNPIYSPSEIAMYANGVVVLVTPVVPAIQRANATTGFWVDQRGYVITCLPPQSAANGDRQPVVISLLLPPTVGERASFSGADIPL